MWNYVINFKFESLKFDLNTACEFIYRYKNYNIAYNLIIHIYFWTIILYIAV